MAVGRRTTLPTSKGCLREPAFQAYIKPMVATCLADPLSAKSQDVAGAVLLYAEKSPFVSLYIGDRIGHILEAAKKAVAGSEFIW